MNRYVQLVRKQWKLLFYGLVVTFFSSFGQTFLISLFVPAITHDFVLTKTGFGSIYSGITLVSGLSLSYFGRWIDKMSLRSYSLLIAGGLVIGSLFMAISWSWTVLIAGLLLLRFFGQGLSSHAARTAMARYFLSDRGTALSIASIGYSVGEALLPGLLATLLAIISWHLIWTFTSLFILLTLVPLVFYLLHQPLLRNKPVFQDHNQHEDEWHYRDILKDTRFYFLVLAVLLPPFWVTGLFLYQISVAHQLGWSTGLIAAAFTGYATARVVSTLAIGPVIDRFTATKLFPFYLIPFGIGLMVAAWHPGNWSAFVYLFLLGITMGAGVNIKSALYAEIYGTRTLGTVRSLFSSLVVLGTAVSPFLMGWLLDHRVSITEILYGATVTVVIAALLSWRLAYMKKAAFVRSRI